MLQKSFLPLILASLAGLSACSSVVLAGDSKLDSLADTLTDRWQLKPKHISWQVTDQHQDHIEFSGEQVSAIIYYGADPKGNLTLNRKVVWPMLRTIPNDTHASLIHDFDLSISPNLSLNNKPVLSQQLKNVTINGVLTLVGELGQNVELTRTLAPSPTKPVIVERLRFVNRGKKSVKLGVDQLNYQHKTAKDKGVYGVYNITAQSDKSGKFDLAPGKTLDVHLFYSATKKGQSNQFDGAQAVANRLAYVKGLDNKLQLETPDPALNRMFKFAKLRAAESIFRTKGGLMHGPGGSRYYAAIWANDQAEYINPFFPFLGDKNGNESALNSFRHFARFMNDDFKPIPSSIIAEGIDIWDGAGDRGDCAMIAYGASRFALASADQQQAKELLPLINWCLEFSFRKMSDKGVIASDSDELEGRFPAGDYNLSTNMLVYGALISSAYLNESLGSEQLAVTRREQAGALRAAVETYFGATVQGFDTYRYFEGNTKLRAWISLPFTMGIFDRKQGTLDALLSPHLWNENGIYSEAGNETFWDRATLYSFRGIFAAQQTDTAMRYFKYYSRKRLLGEHVPYAVEAWPEGNQRHLSAESALYARVVTEGIFGIEPTGFKRFNIAPYLPSEWNDMCLRKIKAFASDFDLCVKRLPNDADSAGYLITINEKNGHQQSIKWAGDGPLSVRL